MPEETPPTTEPEPVDDPNGPKQLREALKRANAQIAEQDAQLRGIAFTEAGLDTTSGLGKAIAQVYDGDTNSESILTFAKDEYGWEPTPVPENPQQPAIQQGQQRLDTIQATSVPVVPITEDEALRTAEQEGDFGKAGAIKAQQLGRMFNPNQ
jgi:hypothetical protein